jgi:signal transduction histidine kinase/ActR/RegA family two-component response regulator
MNEALLVSSIRQHELTEQAQEAEAALRDSEQQLAAELADTKFLLGISAELHQDDEGLYEKIMDAAVAIMRSDFASMQMLYPDRGPGGELRLLAFRGFSPQAARFWEWVRADSESTCGEALRTRQRVVAPNIEKSGNIVGGEDLATYRQTGIQACQTTPLLSRNGTLVGMISTHWNRPHQPSERELRLLDVLARQAADLIERKHTEEQLRLAKRQADEANLAKDMFLATLSHEMRTPLSAIVGWMHILRGGTASGCGEAELNEGLDVIDRNARAMVQLIDDVLDVSRIVSGKVRLEIRPCDLHAVVRAGIDVVRSAAQAKDIKLRLELDPAASAVSCDSGRMQQVVWNLLSNAVKFTPKGGTVRVTLAREQADIRIAVSDSGQGIAANLLPYVFDRFRQADSSTRRQFGGLGLGLSIAKHLVELHGGTIQAESAGEGQGATFTVLLPIRAVRIDEGGDEQGTDEAQEFATNGPPIVRLDALRVLVVDDDPDARRLLVKVLQQAGAVVTAAAGVAEAIDSLPTANPQVLISDLGMPDQDGFDLISQIRAGGHLAKDLPAVALTAFVRKQDRRQALLAGFQMHVPKPVDPHDLTAAIASLAGRTGMK